MIADEMGIAYSALNKILNARRLITEKTALCSLRQLLE